MSKAPERLRRKRFEAIYLGNVVSDVDPAGEGRLEIEVPGVLGAGHPVWAAIVRPFVPLTGDVPAVGTVVAVMFLDGDPAHPVVTGRIGPETAAETVRLTDASGNSITIDPAGIRVADSFGNEIALVSGKMRLTGTVVEIDGMQVKLGGDGAQPAIRGMQLVTELATHVHTAAGPASPTSPPLTPPGMSALSAKVQIA